MEQAYITLIILGIIAFFLATEIIPLAVTSTCAVLSLWFLGILTPAEAFSGLSNNTVVLFAGMFIVGEAMFRTGLAHEIAKFVIRYAGSSANTLMFGIMVLTIIKSATASNTATVACLMPVVIQLCIALKTAASPQLMGLALSANTGGTITQIGTPPNVMMCGALATVGLEPFGFFEFAYIGIPISIASVIYMLTIGKRVCSQNYLSNDSLMAEDNTVYSKKKMYICATIIIAVVVGMIFEKDLQIPLHITSVLGAIACVLTGCLEEKQAYKGIDWVTIFLFAGMLPVASAMEKTGAGRIITEFVMSFVGDKPSTTMLIVAMFTLSCGLSQFMSNTAAAALLAPIGISIAKGMDVSPYPVLMTIGIAASCAFATPVATPPNTLVMNPGKLCFMDYVKVGGPMVIISLILCVIIIPMVWPF